jgi:hypothetical protein
MKRIVAGVFALGLLAGCAAHASALGPRDALFGVDVNAGRVRLVDLEMLGCFGHCPRYRVTFKHDGGAIFTGARCSARAHVPFGRVLHAINEAVGMRPSYGDRANDEFGARVRIVTAHETIESIGINQATWGPQFLITWARLDQLVRDTNWTPALTSQACVDALGLRSAHDRG